MIKVDGSYISKSHISELVNFNSEHGRRCVKTSKDKGLFVNISNGKKIKTLILAGDYVFGTCESVSSIETLIQEG